MRFSVIVPVYNVADYIENCVDSIFNQHYEDFELILVDDGSSDGKSNIICDEMKIKYGDRVTVIHQTNGGLGEARNTGINNSKGDYLVFIDSDDSITPDMLSTISNYVDKYKADIYNFGYFICKDGKAPEPCKDLIPTDSVIKVRNNPEIMETTPTAWTRAWKRALFVDNDIKYPSRVWYEDIRTTEKLFAVSESLVSIDKCFYNYYVRENSITHNKNIDRNVEILYAFEDLITWFKDRGLYDIFYDEISRLAVEHILIAGAVRIIRVDYKNSLLDRFTEFMNNNFPDFKSNPRLETLSKNQKIIYKLICRKRYKAVRDLFRLKSIIN